MFRFLKERRRERIAAEPLPAEWLEILRKNVPLYGRLPDADRQELNRRIQVFLAEKRFEGCGGLELTEEMRVTIAAQACMLELHRPATYYPRVQSILVYPTAYVAPQVEHGRFGVVTEAPQAREGEAWLGGAVVLSWEDVRRGAADVRDGHNLVFHEFAHQLDMADGEGDGTPPLERRSQYVAWARVLGHSYEELRDAAHDGRATLLDKYGATNPAEFFAVATEFFFEKPAQLARSDPALFEELREFYRQDPRAYFKETRAGGGRP